MIKSTLFVRRWIPYFAEVVPSIIGYVFYGTFYKEGTGGFEVFERIHKNISSDEDFEIWTGAYDVDLKRAQFFCNKNMDDSKINQSFFDREQEFFASKSVIYCDGNRERIYEAALASASIPIMTPHTKINGVNYGDGGVMYASPLSVFYKEIFRIVSREEKKSLRRNEIEETEENKCLIFDDEVKIPKHLRLYYIMKSHSSENKNEKIKEMHFFTSAINGSSIQDKNTAINLLMMLSPEGINVERFSNINSTILSELIERFSTRNHVVMFLYPHKTKYLNYE